MIEFVRSLIVIAAITCSSPTFAAAVIDFQTGPAGAGGTITQFGPDHIFGENINISLLILDGTKRDGSYGADALLRFDTLRNFIEITGVVDFGTPLDPVKRLDPQKCVNCTGGGTRGLLLQGSFTDWSFDTIGSNQVFTGTGPDIKSVELLKLAGIDPKTPFEFFGFSIESINGTVISTDIVNTAVPVPAAIWLFGSGILGLIGISRRRKGSIDY